MCTAFPSLLGLNPRCQASTLINGATSPDGTVVSQIQQICSSQRIEFCWEILSPCHGLACFVDWSLPGVRRLQLQPCPAQHPRPLLRDSGTQLCTVVKSQEPSEVELSQHELRCHSRLLGKSWCRHKPLDLCNQPQTKEGSLGWATCHLLEGQGPHSLSECHSPLGRVRPWAGLSAGDW